ncbi:MAG: GDP-L-fucose synthase [Candidatus Omnitrophica bacterium]|nr:GDP-L-fucose synthase [Candidatus Omnitrophota bacterium]
MDKTSKIYIAGHRGLVGSSLIRKLQSEEYLAKHVVVRAHSELDLTRQTDVDEFFNKERPEYVFLSAAKVGGIHANNTYKAEFIYGNIMIAANVINSAYKFGVKKLLNLGSSCIYPKFAPQPMKEEHLLTGSLEPTNEPYAIAKISAIKLCRFYNEQFGTNFISVMPTNLYGYNDNFNLETSHVLPAVLRKFHLAKLLGGNDFEGLRKDILKYPLGFGFDVSAVLESENSIKQTLKNLGITADNVVLWGAGESYREFLYVDDLSDACIFLMNNYDYKDIGEFVNIGTGEDIKIKDMARLIKDIVGFDGDIKHDLSKPEGTPKKLLDISRIKSLGWKPKTTLAGGIKKTYDWYSECGHCNVSPGG